MVYKFINYRLCKFFIDNTSKKKFSYKEHSDNTSKDINLTQ